MTPEQMDYLISRICVDTTGEFPIFRILEHTDCLDSITEEEYKYVLVKILEDNKSAKLWNQLDADMRSQDPKLLTEYYWNWIHHCEGSAMELMEDQKIVEELKKLRDTTEKLSHEELIQKLLEIIK